MREFAEDEGVSRDALAYRVYKQSKGERRYPIRGDWYPLAKVLVLRGLEGGRLPASDLDNLKAQVRVLAEDPVLDELLG